MQKKCGISTGNVGLTLFDNGDLVVIGKGVLNVDPSIKTTLDWKRIQKDTTKIKIIGDVMELGPNIFEGFKKLEEVLLSNSVTTVGKGVFKNCTLLEKINLKKVLKIFSEAFFGCTKLEKIELHSNMELLGDSAFGGCTSLKHVDVPKTSNYIGVGVFEGCTGIKSVIYLNTKFPERIFGNCTSLSKVLVGTQSIIDVSNNAFIQQDPEQDPKQDPEQDPKQDPEQDPEQDPKQDPEQDPKQDPEQDPEQDPKQDPKQKIAMYVEVYDDLENYNKLCGVQFCNKNIEVHCVQ